MKLSWKSVCSWAPSEVLEEGLELQRKGAVGGVQTKDNILAGTVLFSSGGRRLVRMRFVDEAAPPVVDCTCSVASKGKVCKHAVAIAKQWLVLHAAEQDALSFAAEQAPTIRQIEKWCGTELLEKARSIYSDGGVSKVTFTPPEGKGVVRARGVQFDAGFTVSRGGLAVGHCACEAARYGLCEHAMAVAVAVARQYGSPERRQRYEEDRAHAEALARVAEHHGLVERGRGGLLATLVIYVGSQASIVRNFGLGRVPIAISFIVNKVRYEPETLPRERYTFSEGDEALLTTLEDITCGQLRKRIELTSADFVALLRCSARSCVASLETRKRLIYEAAPLTLGLHVVPNIAQDCLDVSLRKPATGHLFCQGLQGFWMDGQTIRPLAHVLPGPYQILYEQDIKIARDQLMRFLKDELPLLEVVAPLEGDAVTPDLFTTTPGQPHFILTLRGSEASVAAMLQVRYGRTVVTAGGQEPVSDPDPDDFYHCYVRNEKAEQDALARLRKMGFQGEDGAHMGALIHPHFVLNILGEGLPQVRRLGWRVELKGAIEGLYERSEVIVPLVKIEGGEKNFEVSTTFESSRGTMQVTAAEIERAMANGCAYIKKDGQTALLDIDAIKRMRETFNSCHASAGRAPGSSCVDNIHAPYVQAALSELEGIDFEESPDWRARASKQNRFSKPEPVSLGPLEGTLRPYQKEGVYWLRFLEEGGFNGILADEMGLGKTLQTLTWLQLPRCREDARRVPALIICPTSLVENWHREAVKFVPQLRVLVISGPHRDALFAKIPKADLVITSYALIRRDSDVYEPCRFSAIVLDEAQAIKNQRTQNAIAVKRLVSDSKLVLSGTPIENGVSDLWSIMDFLMPKYLGPYEEFKRKYEEMIELGGNDAEDAQQRLREKLHPFLLRRVKKEVAKDLPEKIRSITYCELSGDQRAIYDHFRSQMLEKMRGMVKEKGFEKSKFEMLALLMRLRQICCDLRLLKDARLSKAREPSSKLEALMEIMEEARTGGHRVLIFSQFTSMLKHIAARFDEEKVRYCYLDGSTKDRVEQCAVFNQTPSIAAFLISLKAGGTGLNLTGADIVVHFDPWWNPAAEDQATDRAHRIGQKKTVHAIKLIAEDTIEEKVLQLQEKKQALIESMVNASDASIAQTLTWSEIEGLLS